MSKLKLDAVLISGKHLANNSVDDLSKEKKAVKNELKVYD